MNSELKERFERLGLTQVIDRVVSGSPGSVGLCSWKPGTRTIDAIFALARRGATMLRAKRAVEALLDGQVSLVRLPRIESVDALTDELRIAGIEATVILDQAADVTAPRSIEV